MRRYPSVAPIGLALAVLAGAAGCTSGDPAPAPAAADASARARLGDAPAPAATRPAGRARSDGPAPTGTAPRPGTVVLAADGVGVARFGTADTAAVDAVRRVYGRPTADTGWRTVGDQVQGCPGDHVRTVSWGDFQLWLTDGPTDYAAAGRRHLFAYTVGRSDEPGTASPATAANLSVGQTVGDLRATYRTAARVDADGDGAAFRVRLPGGTLLGAATGTGDDGVITLLEAGNPCER